ncbi:MAG: hypothetical protein GY838_08845 [bacterium]|nr:hypothetical protein [bacterium]
MTEGSQEGRSRTDLRELAARVIGLLEPELAAEGFETVDVRLFRGGGRLQVRVYVDLPGGGPDAPGGIGLDDCVRAARTSSMLLEEADLFPGRYVIEVSSPGIRRPLRTPAHFAAAVGQRVDLKVAGQGRVRGMLKEAAPDLLHVETAPDEEIVQVAVPAVTEASLDPEFDVQTLINADRRKRKAEKQDRRRQRREKKRGRNRPGKNSTPDGDGADGST